MHLWHVRSLLGLGDWVLRLWPATSYLDIPYHTGTHDLKQSYWNNQAACRSSMITLCSTYFTLIFKMLYSTLRTIQTNDFSGIVVKLYKIYYIGHLDSTIVHQVPGGKERLLSDSPNMANEVLNYTLESFFLANKAIPSLQPVLQYGTSMLGHLF